MARNLIFMGTGPFALCALEGIYESLDEGDTLSVYTKESKPSGRGMKQKDGAVALFAKEKNLPLYQPHTLRTEESRDEFLSIGADIAIVASYGLILPDYIIHGPKLGCVNIHASLLPKYRGAAPINRVILDGEEKTGVTIMQMDEGLDTGDMLAIRETIISPEENCGELFDRLAVMGKEMILEVLPKLYNKEVVSVPQDHTKSSYAAKITTDDQKIDFNESADQVLRRIRALSPVPCAFCRTAKDGKLLKIYSAKKSEKSFSGKFGEIVAVKPEVLVKTADGIISLGLIQPEGKGRMPALDAVNGRKLNVGDLLV